METTLNDTINFFYEQVKHYRYGVGYVINWRNIWINSLKQPWHIQNTLKNKMFVQILFERNIIERGINGDVLTETGYNEIYYQNRNNASFCK